MSDTDLLIDVTDAWVSGSSEIQAVEIANLRGAPKFMLVPSDLHDRERIAAKVGYCQACEGRGYVPVPFGKEMRTAECRRCRGKCKPLSHPEVRLALLSEICRGWEGWITASGAEVPYSDKMLHLVAADDLLSGVILGESQKLRKNVEEAEGKASEPGLEQP